MAEDHLRRIRARIGKVPSEPGVYRWLGADGTVLYVGKAKVLKNRLKSYVQKDADTGPWKRAMMRNVADFTYTVVNSELEALVLESNLIKELKPKYNVLLKDDKNYVYVRISVQEEFPRVDVVRKIINDGAKYFGPKTSAHDVRQTLTLLRSLYPYRTCRMEMEIEAQSALSPDPSPEGRGEHGIPLQVVCKNKDRQTPCLDHHIGQCTAPCVGLITPADYRTNCIDGVIEFFKGETAHVATLVKEKMQQAAMDKKFELAAQLRDQLKMIEGLSERQIVSDTSREDADVIGVAVLSGRAHVVVFQERGGKVTGESAFALQGGADSVCDVLDQFLPQYYSDAPDVPPMVVIGESCSDHEVLRQWLSDRRGANVELWIPERGKKSKLLELAERNAMEKAKHSEVKWETESRNAEDAVQQLQSALALPGLPVRIEAYDISHLGGTETVGSMVVALHGKAKNDQYRTFAVRSVVRGESDDYASLEEVLTRRLRHLAGGRKREEEQWKEKGYVIGKAKKADLPAITALIEAHPGIRCDTDDINPKAYFIARKDDGIAAICHLRVTDDNRTELTAFWVEHAHRAKGLGRFLARTALAQIKKGKVYARILPKYEQYYTELGFRSVDKPPKTLPVPDGRMVVMYDAAQHKSDTSLEAAPDLIVIDGGKGQLGVGIAVLRELGLSIPVAALAKREEDIFIPGQAGPVQLPKESAAQFLLQRMRDEAHRFANKLRENRGWKQAIKSSLDEIPGVGPATKRDLLKTFGSVEGIRSATDDELLTIVNESQLRALREADERRKA